MVLKPILALLSKSYSELNQSIMKKEQCQAIARNTNNQCSKNAMWRTSYCWVHFPKKEPIIFLIAGALLGLLCQVIWDMCTVSQEEQKIVALQAQIKKDKEELALEKTHFFKNYMNQVTNELGKNLEIAYKWKVSIAKKFAWMETFSTTMMYDSQILAQLNDANLQNKILDTYRQLKNIDIRLQEFRSGLGFNIKDEVNRVNVNLDNLIMQLKDTLVGLKQKGYIVKNIKISLEDTPSNDAVMNILKYDFDCEILSRDSDGPFVNNNDIQGK